MLRKVGEQNAHALQSRRHFPAPNALESSAYSRTFHVFTILFKSELRVLLLWSDTLVSFNGSDSQFAECVDLRRSTVIAGTVHSTVHGAF